MSAHIEPDEPPNAAGGRKEKELFDRADPALRQRNLKRASGIKGVSPVLTPPDLVIPPPASNGRVKTGMLSDVPSMSARPPEKKASPPESSAETPTDITAALKTPDLAELRARSQLEILAVSQRFAEAYRSKDMRRISVLFPEMSTSVRRSLMATLDAAREMEFELTPQGAPDSGPVRMVLTPKSASVRCRRLLRMTPCSGITPKPQQDVCVLIFGHYSVRGLTQSVPCSPCRM